MDNKAMFQIRVMSVDHYISKPIEELYDKKDSNLRKEWQEPVLRIFGVTPDGFKSCVHIHGVYPYIYVPYKGGENPERNALLLGAALDEALKTSLNKKICRFIYKVTLISGIPLYGYHSKLRQFFKIYFYNPFHIRKATELLVSGAILGQKFQPHEAHIPYTLQFMMDYNIYGMSFVTFSQVKYRKDPSNPDSLIGVRKEDILSDNVKKITWSHLEVDALAGQIMNRVVQKTVGVNPGLQALWEDEQQRRRAQNKSSQIAIEQSQSRPDTAIRPTEVLYKARLAEKLSDISDKDSETAVSDEPIYSYPAEVPKNSNILNASAVGEDLEVPEVRENVSDLSGLVDERILTQISGSQENRGEESESEGEMEFDSVLGRNQKSEEEAELEEEEGVDMTQPLDSDEEVICGAERNRDEPGNSRGEGEENFWRNMADKIFQLDGTHESSSESETDLTCSSAPSVNGVSDGPVELSSAWSSNIMSILSEGSGSPTPFATCQTPRTFWFDHSPDWFSPIQETWLWNKNGTFSDLLGKNQNDNLVSNDFFGGSKEAVSGEYYDDLFNSQYFPSSSETMLCNVESAAPPASAVLTSASERGEEVNLDSNRSDFHMPLKEKRKTFSVKEKSLDSKVKNIKGKSESDQQKLLQVLKSFAGRKVPLDDNCNQLTLKQYIKDCKEIVNVDFKNLCNREMIIIEYKSRNQRSLRNKYLIKPLDKFLESWNSAERRAIDRSSPKRENELKVVKEFDIENEKNYVINVVGKTFSDTSTVQSVSNKLTVKSMEILPEGGNTKDRCYNVNENVISRGKIKMKLIKSQRENLEKNQIEGTINEERGRTDLKCMKASDRKEMRKGNEKIGGNQRHVEKEEKIKKVGKWKNLTEPDTKLINDINSSFEEYFKSVVKRKKVLIKSNKNVLEKMNLEEDDEEEEEGEEEEEEEKETSEDENLPSLQSQDIYASCSTDPIKFVTRFLSTFSHMQDVPPLSITIRLGNARGCAPVRVNFRPSITSTEKQGKHYSKRHGRKAKIENVDGPADDSSSEDSSSGDPKRRRSSGQKKSKKGHYKPLDVIAYGVPGEKGVGGKRKTIEGVAVERKKSRRSFSQDSFSVSREKTKPWSFRKDEDRSSGSEVRRDKKAPNAESRTSELSVQELYDSSEEADYIGDSEEERERKALKRRKNSSRQPPTRIPQADTEDFVSSEEETRSGRAGEKSSSAMEDLQPGRKDESSDATRDLSLEPMKEVREEGKKKEKVAGASGDLRDRGSPGSEILLRSDSISPFALSGSLMLESDEKQSSGLLTRSQDEFSSPGEKFPIRKKSFDSSKSSERIVGCSLSPETKSVSLDWISGRKKMKPNEKPLTRKEVVESLQNQFLIETEDNAAFYGDPLDGARTSEIHSLNLKNHSAAGPKPHKNSLSVLGLEERRGGRNSERHLWGGSGDARIRPLANPPSRESALRSWFSRMESENDEKDSEKGKIKIMKPLSPGQEMGSEEDMELSVTVSSFSGESAGRGPVLTITPPEVFSKPTEANKGAEVNFCLKKGPLCKIKGIKRFALLRRSGEAKNVEVSTRESTPAEEGERGREKRNSVDDNSFQIRGVTLEDTFGFPHSVENFGIAKFGGTHQYMSMLVVEVHVQTRKDLRPDPDHDPIRALFYTMTFDCPRRKQDTGVIVVGQGFLSGSAVSGLIVHYVATEKALVEKFLSLVREWDPEILAGYEVEMNSWGYLVQRGFVLDFNLILLLGRVQGEDFSRKTPDWSDPSSGEGSDDVPRSIRRMKISGRIVLDVWRVLRHEIALRSYTFENVMYHLAHERHPALSYERLSYYWEHPSLRFRHFVVEHFVTRVLGLVKILDQLDFINRTSELARLFGIQFYEVLSRGSQFRVESMMLRLAKPLNYVPVSPTISQRAAMRAPASLPLILEPESLFYTDPVIVLDFQSLYPSIIIAYNYCFSTCLGRVEKLGNPEPFEFGCTQLQISREELKILEKDLSISPAGVAFVKANIRKGVLPAMLEKILETRLMVKKSMKENKENKILQKILFSRQLGLKLIANVTYGYTAANFSGRMPCIEVGDSVVSKGRETLHRAIQLVKNTRKWGARVVYGDTDSVFVLTPGRSKEEAFKIGAEIAEAVTQDNPKPVKLKLEKVYQPCILQTKKRYVGFMFESPSQKKPTFEAKGIETVRRDGCLAAGKILEKALRILFDTRDVSLVKKYTVRQFAKLYQGSVALQDLIFAKEYRGRNGYRPGACVPALQLAKQWTEYDKRAEPRVKERVPYVIVNGPPGVPLIRLVRSPTDLISDPSLRINAVYYIMKAIVPPMQRCFSLLGVDVASWYSEMPRKYHTMYKSSCAEGQKRSTISQYFATLKCVVCSEVTSSPLCQKCENEPQTVAVILEERIRHWERRLEGLTEMCRSCFGRPAQLDCVSLDCPVLFRREHTRCAAGQGEALREIFNQYLRFTQSRELGGSSVSDSYIGQESSSSSCSILSKGGK